MNHQARDVQLLELAERIEDVLTDIHRLVTGMSLDSLARKHARQVERNGPDSIGAIRSIGEYRQEKQRLVSEN